jgi:hypothetical protein
MWVTRVLVVLGGNPGFRDFKDLDQVLGYGWYSPRKKQEQKDFLDLTRKPSTSISSSSPLSILSGGGDYRGIYDIGFKRGF